MPYRINGKPCHLLFSPRQTYICKVGSALREVGHVVAPIRCNIVTALSVNCHFHATCLQAAIAPYSLPDASSNSPLTSGIFFTPHNPHQAAR